MTNLPEFQLLPLDLRPEIASGVLAAAPPRRVSRGRAEERLALFLTFDGPTQLTPEQHQDLLTQTAKVYYATPGSVTGALREALEALNRFLLERNLRQVPLGEASAARRAGWLTMLVQRDRQLYLAQAGQVHAYLLLAGGVQAVHDPDLSGPGLGLTQTPQARYFTASLALTPETSGVAAGVVISHQAAPRWTLARLAEVRQAPPGEWAERLIVPGAAAGAPLPALGVYWQLAAPAVAAVPSVARARPLPPRPSEAAASTPPVASPAARPRAVQTAPPAAGAAVPAASNVAPAATVTAASAPPAPPRPPRLRRLSAAFTSWMARLVPDETFNQVSNSTLAFFAVAVPLMIVTMASLVYLNRGRAAQYELLYQQATVAAEAASAETNLLARRTAWQNALDLTRQAETYVTSAEAQDLRLLALQQLDELDLIRRPDFRPAIIGGLAAGIRISRMEVAQGDLYLLDDASGIVLRAIKTQQGYEIDRDFQCGSPATPQNPADPLVDIAKWPREMQPSATLLALDAGGNLFFCNANGQPPTVQRLAAPADHAWNDLRGMAIDMGSIYVLDSSYNAVWAFWNGQIDAPPEMVFNDEENIPTITDVNDLAVSNYELYLLHDDGHVTLCSYSGLEGLSTQCSQPKFIDLRPGREQMELVMPSPFTQILFSPPPDPSLFLLEAQNQAIYHFSLRTLTFQRQYLPQDALSRNPATAFMVNTLDRTLFMAFGNEVYYALMP